MDDDDNGHAGGKDLSIWLTMAGEVKPSMTWFVLETHLHTQHLFLLAASSILADRRARAGSTMVSLSWARRTAQYAMKGLFAGSVHTVVRRVLVK